MKTQNLKASLSAIFLSLTFVFAAGTAAAQEPTAQDSSASAAATPELSYGVPQVLQLAQGKVSDDVIINYIQNSGTIYALKAPEIVYLKQQGVSDSVLNAMLNQRDRITGSTEPTPATSESTASAQPIVVQPVVAYVRTVPSSTVYIIPDTQTARYTHHFTDPRYGFRYGNGFDDLPYSYSSIVTVIGTGRNFHSWHGRSGFRGGFHHGWH